MGHAAGSWLSVRICAASLVSVPIVTDTLPVWWTLPSVLRNGKGPMATFLLDGAKQLTFGVAAWRGPEPEMSTTPIPASQTVLLPEWRGRLRGADGRQRWIKANPTI
jgi:hypothetical protein